MKGPLPFDTIMNAMGAGRLPPLELLHPLPVDPRVRAARVKVQEALDALHGPRPDELEALRLLGAAMVLLGDGAP